MWLQLFDSCTGCQSLRGSSISCACWFTSRFWDTCQNISQTWHRLPIFQVDLHCVLYRVATSSWRGHVDELATEPFLLLHREHGKGCWNCCDRRTCLVVIWKHLCFILSTGTKIRIDYVMRPRSSSRRRNTSASVTVTVTYTKPLRCAPWKNILAINTARRYTALFNEPTDNNTVTFHTAVFFWLRYTAHPYRRTGLYVAAHCVRWHSIYTDPLATRFGVRACANRQIVINVTHDHTQGTDRAINRLSQHEILLHVTSRHFEFVIASALFVMSGCLLGLLLMKSWTNSSQYRIIS